MYETSKEQEEKRLAEEAAKLKKRTLIDTIVVVIIVGIIAAVVYANWDKIMGTKKEDNKPTEEKEIEKPTEEEKTYQRVKVDTTGKINDTVELTLNGKTLKITYSLDEKMNLVFIMANGERIHSDSYRTPFKLEYEIFKSAADQKEYVLLSYTSIGDIVDIIVNSEGKAIANYDEYNEATECYYSTEEAISNDTSVRVIKDGYIYNYSYDGSEDKNPVELTETKIAIKDDLVSEMKTDKKVPGLRHDCE